MKKIKLAAFLAVGFMISTVAAHQFNIEMVNDGNMQHLQEEINTYSYPDFIGSIVGNQTINVRIESENSTKIIGAKMDGTHVEELRIGKYENATLSASVSAQTITNITSSRNPIQVFSEKLKKGAIEYETKGFMNSMKFYLAKKALMLFSGF